MNLDYVPLLPIQRELQSIPRGQPPSFNGLKRFRHYLRTISDGNTGGLAFPPLVMANPMAKEHVTARLDQLLALDADRIAAQTAAHLSAKLSNVPGDAKVSLVILDDWMAGWTNRYSVEFTLRFQCCPLIGQLPRWTKHFWVSAVVWSSEEPTERSVREAMATAIYRTAYVQRNGAAITLRDRVTQEGQVMKMAGCDIPTLDPDDLEYTREVVAPFLDADDMRTAIECLFGDGAARALGFTPRGLSPWAGLALALHDALRFEI
jgi:hypothetical protein